MIAQAGAGGVEHCTPVSRPWVLLLLRILFIVVVIVALQLFVVLISFDIVNLNLNFRQLSSSSDRMQVCQSV